MRADFPIPGQNPVKLAAGDLNGDGAPELVVSLEGGDPAFAILPGDGAGGFGPAKLYSTGFAALYPAGVEVADVDLDGDRDVLYGTDTNGGAGYTPAFALFRNTGSSSLAPPESVPVGEEFGVIYDFAVDDVTGDGWPDVLGTMRQSQEGFVLVPGDGAGGFGEPESFRAGEYSRAVTLEDVDGDGDLDAVVTNSASLTVTIQVNHGSGFAKPAAFPLGKYIAESAAADLDLDGDVDLLTGDFDAFLVLDNLGGGDLVLEEQPSVTWKAFAKLRDLDGDGDPDAVFAGQGLSRALNDGGGTFGPVVHVPLTGPVADVDTLDADGDGDLDAVVSGETGAEAGFSLLVNDGAGNFGPPIFAGSPQVPSKGRVATGDFTGDGIPDVVTGSWQALWLWPGNGAGGFGAPVERDLGSGGTAGMTSGDFDGDGLSDVAGSHWGTSPEGENLTVVFGTAAGTFTEPVTYLGMFSQWLGGVGGLTATDVDGDADLDLVGGCRGADDVAIFANNGDRTFAPEQRYGVDGGVTWVTSADLDGDGRGDVAAHFENTSPEGGGLAVLLSAAGGPFLDLGHALPGSGGVPVLVGSGTPAAGSTAVFDLSGAATAADGFLVVASVRADLPFAGGVLVPAPQLLVPLVTDSKGAFTLPVIWPAGMPVGTTNYLQAWMLDPPAASGVSASNALQVVTQ